MNHNIWLKLKTPKLLKILNKGVTNLRERKLKNMQLTKIPRKQIKSMREDVHVSLPMLSLGFFDVIGEIKRAAREYKKNTKGGGKRKIVTWNLKAKEIFYNLHEKKTIISHNRPNFGSTARFL